MRKGVESVCVCVCLCVLLVRYLLLLWVVHCVLAAACEIYIEVNTVCLMYLYVSVFVSIYTVGVYPVGAGVMERESERFMWSLI